MQRMEDNGNGGADQTTVAGIREANSEQLLGLKRIEVRAPGVSPHTAELFADWLHQLAREAGGFDATGAREEIASVDGSPVRWSRSRFTLYPVYVERLAVVADDAFQAGEDFVPVPVRLRGGAPGEWTVPARVLSDGPDCYVHHRAGWARLFESASRAALRLGGGLALNVLDIPREALVSGAVDLRPLSLHALAADGSACDRGNPAAQAAVANAFWQTFWATGALRSERGATFPVAFLPVDRAAPCEFEGPFRERYVSMNRRFFGRTAILAHLNEVLTRNRALFLDTRENCFCIAADFEPAAHDVTVADVRLSLDELNRTGFVDAFTGQNRETFAGWREREAALGAAARVPLTFAPANESALPEHCRAGSDTTRFVRIHRVVPYAGCAFLSEVVNHTEDLRTTGKIRGFDEPILAATNSTFFLNFPEEYAALHSAMNDPVSLLVEEGRTLQIRTVRRAAFVLSTDGEASITTRAGNGLLSDILIYEGESQAATAFTRADRPLRENKFGPLFFGSVVIGRDIVETFEEMATEIPANAWLVGDSEAYGGAVDPRHVADARIPARDGRGEVPVRHAFAVGPLLVEDGVEVPLGETREEFHPIVLRETPSFQDSANLARTQLAPAFLDCESKGVPPTRFPHDWDQTRAPRSAIGVRADGSVVLVVVDGRANLNHSVGVTLAELARLMRNLGCTDAMNMDGGGSSVMFVNDPRARALKLSPDLRDGVVNLPSDLGGVERLLPVPLIVSLRKTGR